MEEIAVAVHRRVTFSGEVLSHLFVGNERRIGQSAAEIITADAPAAGKAFARWKGWFKKTK